MNLDFEQLYHECRSMLEDADKIYKEYKLMNGSLLNVIHDLTYLLDKKTLKIIRLEDQIKKLTENA